MHNLRMGPKLLLSLLPTLAALIFFCLIISQTHFTKPAKQITVHHLRKQTTQSVAISTCQDTLYRDLCVSTLNSFQGLTSKSVPQIISSTVNKTMYEVVASYSNCTRIKKHKNKIDAVNQRALDDCLELLESTVAELKSVMADLNSNKSPASKHYNHLRTLLSAAMTNQYTCLDGFNATTSAGKAIKAEIESRLHTICRHVSNALAMLKKIPGVVDRKRDEYGRMKNGFPSWVGSKARKLLQASSANATNYDLVVAKDGSGNFTTISDAVEAAPNSSTTNFVIYIKAGAYFENVEVVRKKTNLMFLGDGIGKTVVKASRNVVDGWTTFQSATVAVVGGGFIAKGITIENSAGPSKHQAVALRSGSDFSAFYQCSFVGYQDTLYVHSLRQFYRDCDIYGTVDFVFGNAAVVLQNCNLYARKPNESQKNIFTAQGREDPNQNTGISLLNCKLAAAADLIPVKSEFKTFLGRPWKVYSRTVVLRSNIEDVVDPAGWLEWNGTFALDTLYYGEYLNRGGGSNTSARVTWPGYRVINSSVEASQFTVGEFIQGNEWLNSSGFPYYVGLG